MVAKMLKNKAFVIVAVVLLLVAIAVSAYAVSSKNKANEAGDLYAKYQSLSSLSRESPVAYYKDEAILKSTFEYHKEAENLKDPEVKDPDYSDMKLLKSILTHMMIEDEATQAGLAVSDKEVDDALAEQKSFASQSAEAMQFVTDYCASAGITEDQYWQDGRETLRSLMVENKHIEAFDQRYINEKGWSADALDSFQRDELRSAYKDYLEQLYQSHKKDIRILIEG